MMVCIKTSIFVRFYLKDCFLMKKVLILLCATTLTGCGVYKSYDSQSSIPQDVYGIQTVDTSTNLGQTGWHQMFGDQHLQTLIEGALRQNLDAKTALLSIEKAEIAYKTSRLAYLPTFAFSPSAGLVKNGSDKTVYSGTLGISASWQLDIFGAGITNAKRKAKAAKQYAADYEQAVECRLIASTASMYYNLLSLDKRLEILKAMIALYEKTYDMVQTLYEVGQYNSAAVSQTKAQLEALRVQLIDTENIIITTEHGLCELLNEPYRHIVRGSLDDAKMPACLGTGVPADLLRYRPDVRVAERNIEMAYYDVQLSKGRLYPSITLSADGGWAFVDPVQWFVSGVGSLVQPIFQGGQLRADLKIKKLEQQIAVEEFRSTVIKAGHEVTSALADCQLSQAKTRHIEAQVEALSNTVFATQELMNNGSSNYQEVLQALQEMLQAQVSEVENKANGMDAVVRLYAALGGK